MFLHRAENEKHEKVIAEQQRAKRERKANADKNRFGSISGAFEEGITAKEFEVQLQESSSDEDSDENENENDDDEHRKKKVKPKAIENEDQMHISIDINKHIPAKDNVNSYNQIVRGTTSISPSRAAQAFKASSSVLLIRFVYIHEIMFHIQEL